MFEIHKSIQHFAEFPMKNRDGIIVFKSNNDTLQLTASKVLDCMKEHHERNSLKFSNNEFPITLSIGNFFYGRFIDESAYLYDNKSFTIEITSINSRKLKQFAAAIADYFEKDAIFYKENSKDKIYYLQISN
jgi:hypothetical protein